MSTCMPPAAWKWFTSAWPLGYMRVSSGTAFDRSARSSQSSSMPAAAAMATRCRVWLVEPPVASSATQALTIAFSSTTSPTGVYSSPCTVSSTARVPAAFGQRLAQLGARVDEGRARQVQAHDLDHAPGWSWRCRRRCRCRGSGRTADSASSSSPWPTLPSANSCRVRALTLLGRPEVIGPAGHEDRRQMAEVQRADQQARHDLVADAEQQRGVEHVVRERDRGGHGDDVAAVERQLHARAALRDAVAHGGHAAGELGDAARLADGRLEDRRVGLVRLVRRQHVVVARHDRHARLDVGPQVQLVGGSRGGEAVGEVGAAQARAGRALARAASASRGAVPDTRYGWRGCARRRSVTSWMTGSPASCRRAGWLGPRCRWPLGDPVAHAGSSSCQARSLRLDSSWAPAGPELPAGYGSGAVPYDSQARGSDRSTARRPPPRRGA